MGEPGPAGRQAAWCMEVLLEDIAGCMVGGSCGYMLCHAVMCGSTLGVSYESECGCWRGVITGCSLICMGCQQICNKVPVVSPSIVVTVLLTHTMMTHPKSAKSWSSSSSLPGIISSTLSRGLDTTTTSSPSTSSYCCSSCALSMSASNSSCS